MNKNKRVISFFVLTCICLFVTQTFFGCVASYTQPQSNRLREVDFTGYISENLDQYKDRIKKETGFEGKTGSGVIYGQKQKYIEFDIDDTTKIKFVVDHSTVIITKQYKTSKEDSYTNTMEVCLIGMDEDDDVTISLEEENGFISVDYKANDFDKPLNTGNEKYEHNDLKIKVVESTEELNKLTLTAHSIYKVFKDICKEYNESQKNK